MTQNIKNKPYKILWRQRLQMLFYSVQVNEVCGSCFFFGLPPTTADQFLSCVNTPNSTAGNNLLPDLCNNEQLRHSINMKNNYNINWKIIDIHSILIRFLLTSCFRFLNITFFSSGCLLSDFIFFVFLSVIFFWLFKMSKPSPSLHRSVHRIQK